MHLLAFLAACATVTAQPVGATLRVPLDYQHRGLGTGTIYYELGAKFDRQKPTVFVVSDGQQFYVRKGRVSEIQKSFCPSFNVVGVVGRAESPSIVAAVRDKN